MKKILSIALLLNCLIVFGQNELNIVPMTAESSVQLNVKTKFIITKSTLLSYNSELLKKDVDFLISQIKFYYGFSVVSKLEPVNFKKKQKNRNKILFVK